MLFSSLTFLFSFFPCLLLVYFLIPKKYIAIKNGVLFIFSLLFYAWGEPNYIILMLGTVFVSYLFGLGIHTCQSKKKDRLTKVIFIASIIVILSSLVYFKYFNFLLSNIAALFSFELTTLDILLPIGISFYTFQILSFKI